MPSLLSMLVDKGQAMIYYFSLLYLVVPNITYVYANPVIQVIPVLG